MTGGGAGRLTFLWERVSRSGGEISLREEETEPPEGRRGPWAEGEDPLEDVAALTEGEASLLLPEDGSRPSTTGFRALREGFGTLEAEVPLWEGRG